MKVLLTGAGGQLGRAIQQTFTRHELLALDRDGLDVADLAAVRRTLASAEPDLVLNTAAYTDVDGAESDPDAAYLGNEVAARNLAIATAERSVALAHISTDYVFDGSAARPYHELDTPNPRTTYGRSKLAGEEAVREENPRHYIARTAWLYAAHGANFVLTMRSLAERGEVRVVDDQHGSPTYAPHLAEALQTLIETDAFGTHHLAGSGVASWYELTCRLYALLGLSTRVEPVDSAQFPRPAERPRFSALTSLRQPRIALPDWQEGLRACSDRLRAEA